MIVSNKRTYLDAMKSLELKFGNIHMIMRLLIEDIKSIPFVKKGDFKAFEKFSFSVNEFKDR